MCAVDMDVCVCVYVYVCVDVCVDRGMLYTIELGQVVLILNYLNASIISRVLYIILVLEVS